MNPGFDVGAFVSTVLQSSCVHFTPAHAPRGSSLAMIEKCQPSSSHGHPPFVPRSQLTDSIPSRRFQAVRSSGRTCRVRDERRTGRDADHGRGEWCREHRGDVEGGQVCGRKPRKVA